MKPMHDLAKGYFCKCGTWHAFPPYVYAHWTVEIQHTCECGLVVLIQNGITKTTDGETLSSEVPLSGAPV